MFQGDRKAITLRLSDDLGPECLQGHVQPEFSV